MTNQPKICIFQNHLDLPSETFIRALHTSLPANILTVHLSDGGIPLIANRPIFRQELPFRAVRRLQRRLTGKSDHWEFTRGLLAAIRRHPSRVVLAEVGTMAVLAMEACEIARVPLVAHFHGNEVAEYTTLERYREAYPRLFRQAVGLVVVSNSMRERLVRLGADPAKIHVIACGVDPRQFFAGQPSGNGPVALAVGRLVEKKGMPYTLQSFARVVRAYPDARLRVIGEGEMEAVCRDRIAALGLENHVTLLGARDHAFVAEEMRNARLFVQHSLIAENGGCEGTPVSILEASASGLPVVFTRHEGIVDSVLEGKSGFLVEERDIEAMADRMLRFFADPALADQMGREGRRWIEQHFTLKQSSERLWGVLEAAIAGREIAPVRLPFTLDDKTQYISTPVNFRSVILK